MTLQALRDQRAQRLREAEALRTAEGTFATDDDRAAFDAHMVAIEAIDAQIRARESTSPAPAGDAPRLTLAGSDIETERQRARTAERTRISEIRAIVRAARLDEAVAETLITEAVSVGDARTRVIDHLADDQRQTDTRTSGAVEMGEDARDTFLRGATNWLLQRTGMTAMVAQHEQADPASYAPGEFRGLSLFDLAKACLTRASQPIRGLDRLQIVERAFLTRAGNYQTISDFAVLLENTMHKILRAAYAITPDTWRRWCGTTTVSDFRNHNWYRLGSLSALDDLLEHGEFKNKTIPDAEKASFSATTKGNLIAISRQTVINDDVGMVARLTSMLGRAAALSIETKAFALLGENSGLGPTQSDSQPLFHANRSNVGAGAALSAAAIDADAAIMAAQQDPNSQDYLDLQPNVLLVPRGLRGTAITINEAVYDPDTANKLQKPNAVRGLFADVVATPRLSGTRRYLFADPVLAPVFLVSFLEGQMEPVLETRDGWQVDGVELKTRLDFGVNAVDFRGAVTDAGA